MLFSSTVFIFVFLPAVLLIYYLLSKKFRNYFLLIASLIFYAWGEPKFVLAMIASILVNYLFGLAIDKFRTNKNMSRTFLIFALCLNIGLFFVFKYLNFSILVIDSLFNSLLPQTNIALPIGISFFTFQAMSYVIDIYRNDAPVQKNVFYVGLYIAFFPQLIAGPIVRYNTIADQIINRTVNITKFSEGIRRFIIGLCKKVLLANTLAVIADKAFSMEFGDLSVSFAWLGVIAYTFQIFFDFSGYSDMAIGLGLMFGFRFMENFNFPYISASISEFWRRWHISLGSWFRDYVYFPLGGSRVQRKPRLVLNLLIVWSLTGIWHGASWNFLIWGMMYFVLIAFEKLSGIPKKFKKVSSKTIYRIFTLLCVVLGWALFRASNLSSAMKYIASMLGLQGNKLFDGQTLYYFLENIVFIIFATLCSTRLFAMLREKTLSNGLANKGVKIVSTAVYVILFLLSVSYLILESYNPFIYFNF